MNTNEHGSNFTLIELLIVIGLLGAVSMLILPGFRTSRTEALRPAVDYEMQEIRRAFMRFCSDVAPTDDELDYFRTYGLAPLMKRELDGGYELDSWDHDRRRGWRGPYIEPQGRRVVDGENGQKLADSSGTSIPVVVTPYSSSDEDGHFYRVMSRQEGGDWVHEDLALVFPGADGELSTMAEDGEEEWEEKYTAGDGELVQRLVVGK